MKEERAGMVPLFMGERGLGGGAIHSLNISYTLGRKPTVLQYCLLRNPKNLVHHFVQTLV